MAVLLFASISVVALNLLRSNTKVDEFARFERCARSAMLITLEYVALVDVCVCVRSIACKVVLNGVGNTLAKAVTG